MPTISPQSLASSGRRLLLNPVFGKELLVQLRRSSSFLIAFLYMVVLMWMLVGAWPSENRILYNVENLGFQILMMIGGAMIILGPLAAGVISSASLVGEREAETIDLLKTSLLSTHKVIIGKLCSSLAYVLILIVIALPALGLAYMLGGVSLFQIFGIMGLVVVNTLVWGMTGMACSMLRKKSYLATLLFMFIYFGSFFLTWCFFAVSMMPRNAFSADDIEAVRVVIGAGVFGLVVSLGLIIFLIFKIGTSYNRKSVTGKILSFVLFAFTLLVGIVSIQLMIEPRVHFDTFYEVTRLICHYLSLSTPMVQCFYLAGNGPWGALSMGASLGDLAIVWVVQFAIMYLFTWALFRRPEASGRRLLDMVLRKDKKGKGKTLRQMFAVRRGPITDGRNPVKALEERSQRIGNPYFLLFIGAILFLLSFSFGWFLFIYLDVGYDREANVVVPVFIWVVALLLAPSYAATSITTERNRNTWDLLSTTLVTPRQIVRAKHAINMRYTLMVFLSLFGGLWVFCVYYSLFEPPNHSRHADCIWALITSPLLAWISLRFASALGIALSSFTKKPIAAQMGSYAILLLLYLGSIVFVAMMDEIFRIRQEEFWIALLCSPWTSIYIYESSKDERWFALIFNLGFYLFATFFLLRIAEMRVCRKE
jgi:ABC-2 family transporter protein